MKQQLELDIEQQIGSKYCSKYSTSRLYIITPLI